MSERDEEIKYWWSGGFPGAFAHSTVEEPRLFQAFRAVLLAMPDPDYESFMAQNPTIVCQPRINGAVFRYSVVG